MGPAGVGSLAEAGTWALGLLAPEPSRLELMRLFPGSGSADFSHPRVNWGAGGGGALPGGLGSQNVTLPSAVAGMDLAQRLRGQGRTWIRERESFYFWKGVL